MNLVRIAPYVIAVTLTLGNAQQRASAYGESGYISSEIAQCRQMESSGQWYQAGQGYYGLLLGQVNMNGGIAPDFKVALMRRALACMTRAANSSNPGERSQAQQALPGFYVSMAKLDPNNPTWPYLLAQYRCAIGGYLEAKENLQDALATTGGQPAVRDKARKLLAHIGGYMGADRARVAREANAPGVRQALSRLPDTRGQVRMARPMTPDGAARKWLGQQTAADKDNGW
ncbi:MAG: hypothetical protein JST89_04125 [Cyanobacteria bacterium SZAS-4]|nr:hypothetical protein [Cyanobacteria bacterium SZAS-4]